jgi:hypothetical protein
MDLGLSFLAPIAEQQRMDQSAALAPANLAHQVGLGRLANAQATALETQNVATAKAAALMAQRLGKPPTTPDGSPQTLSGMSLDMAQIFAEAGLPNKAEQAMKTATSAMSHEVALRAQTLREATAKLTGAKQTATIMSNLAADVTDQESWDRANQVYSQVSGKESPFAKMPYDPKFVEMIKDSAITMKQKADMAEKAAMDAARIANIKSLDAHRQAQEQIARDKMQQQRERATAVGKVGGKDVGAPAAGEIAAAKGLLRGEDGLVSETDLPTAAFDVAAKARAIRKSNPGIAADEALRQAVIEKKMSGDFQPPTPGMKVFGLDTGIGAKAGKYKPGGAAGDSIDPSKTPKSQLQLGKVYKDAASGKSWQWTKDGWKAPSAADDDSTRAD